MATGNQRPAAGGNRPNGKKVSKQQRESRKKKKVIIFGLEVLLLVAMLGVLWFVIKGTEVKKVEINDQELEEQMNETVLDNETLKGYRNIALFGVDSTTGALEKGTRSDTIIIASINQDTGDVKLVSVYRDTYLNKGNDKYGKCNAAYANNGPKQAMMMLNTNMDLNITDFVTVGFKGLTDAIDALGGVYIDVDSEEIKHINNYQMCIAENLKCSYTEVKETGYQLLNGLQATAYCRIRYTKGDDFMRAQRQREVIQAIADQAKNASITSLTKIANDVFPEVYTSLKLEEIVSLLTEVSKYNIVEEDGFPTESLRATGTVSSAGSCVIPVDLEANVKWLHEFLFNESDYQVSKEIISYSDKIKSDTGVYLK